MYKVSAIILLMLMSFSIFAQYEDTPPTQANELGAGVTVAMSGFALGGFYRIALPNFFSVGANVDIYMLRDEKEYTYYDPYYDPYGYYPIQVNKFNRLFIIPVNLELKKRIFQNSIEDNFRPYFIGLTGITFGMNFPKTDSYQFQNLSPEEREALPQGNEYRFTLSFALGFGIDFSTNDNFFFSIRPQYRINYFPVSIATKKNHSSFEIRFELGKRKLK